MTDIPPEADAAEQAQEVDSGPDHGITADPEAPEADVLEQHQLVEPGDDGEVLTTDPEVPEADALEQAQTVRHDESEDWA